MKRATRCLVCSEVKRYSNTYAIRLQELTKSFLTGKTKTTEVVGRMCRQCAMRAGYKVSTPKVYKKKLPL